MSNFRLVLMGVNPAPTKIFVEAEFIPARFLRILPVAQLLAADWIVLDLCQALREIEYPVHRLR
jgi:hypothetical protein